MEFGLHVFFVEGSVYLGSGAPDGGALAAVQDTELDPGLVGDTGAEAVKSIYLTHHDTFSDAAERGVAGAGADCVDFLGYKGGSCAGYRSERCLRPGRGGSYLVRQRRRLQSRRDLRQ